MIGPIVVDAQRRMRLPSVRREVSEMATANDTSDLSESLLNEEKELLSEMIAPFFDKYAKGDDNIDVSELKLLLADLNEVGSS